MKKRTEPRFGGGRKEDEEKNPEEAATGLKSATNPALEIFDCQLHSDLFSARCHDTGETISGK